MNKKTKKPRTIRICLVGFMGAGKTSVAEILATKTKAIYVDLDELIEVREGQTTGQIIETLGETAFRGIETDTLREILQTSFLSQENRLIALGGGAWTIAENRTLIAKNDFRAVWLDAPFEVCWQRIIESSQTRPLAKSKETTRKLFEARHGIYQLAETCAKIESGQTPVEIADKILKLISKPKSKIRTEVKN